MPKKNAAVTKKEIRRRMDQLLAEVFDEALIAKINAENNLNLTPYKAHSDEELEKLYADHELELEKEAGEQASRDFEFYQHADLDKEYVQVVRNSCGNDLKRLYAYALKPETSEDPEENKKIREDNMKILENLKKPEEQKKFLLQLKNKLLKTDFTILLTGNEDEILDFAKKNPDMIGAGWACVNDLRPLLKKYNLAGKEEMNTIERNIKLYASGTQASGLAKLMSLDMYPLLKEAGYADALYFIFDHGFGVQDTKDTLDQLSSSQNPVDQEVYKEVFQLKGINSDVTALASGKKERSEMKESLDNLLADDPETQKLIDLSMNDPYDYMIGNKMFSRDNVPYPDTTPKEQILEDIRSGVVVSVQFPSKNGTSREPVQFKYDKKNHSLTVHSYYAEKTMEHLKRLRRKLEDVGSRMNDSGEYTTMMSELVKLTDSPKHFSNKQMAKAMKNVVNAAEEYYFAKLESAQNTTRAARFEAAYEIRTLYADLTKRREHVVADNTVVRTVVQQLKVQIEDKFNKVVTLNNIRTMHAGKAVRKAREEQFVQRTNRQAFYDNHQLYKEQIDDILDKKNVEYLKRLRNMPMDAFITEIQGLLRRQMQFSVKPAQNNPADAVKKNSNPVRN